MELKAAVITVAALVCALGAAESATAPQTTAVVRGAVFSDTGQPLPYANVFFTDGFEGAMCADDGRFAVTVTTFGERTLVASYIAREIKTKVLNVSPGDTVYVEFTLGESPIELEEIVATASAYDLADRETASLNSLDVVRTPGAAADVFRALQTFPGLVQVDEGAGLFVRGGDVSETLTLLDRATVGYPYRYSSPTGGFFGMFDPFLLSGIHFSTGAFPARYGNALSAVVDLESKGFTSLRSMSFTVSLAGISVLGSMPIGRNWGIRVAGNRTHTGLLFRLNGGLDDFEKVPQSIDGSFSLNGKFGHSGSVKLFGFASEDGIAADVETPTHDGTYQGTGRTFLGNLTFSHLTSDRFHIRGSLSGTEYSQSSNLGILALEINDLSEKARIDASLDLGSAVTLNSGLEVEGRSSDVDGTVPGDENDFSVGADSLLFSTRYRSLRTGYYVELDTRFVNRLLLNVGIRADHESNSSDFCIDPRISTVFKMTEHGGMKLAWGVYHQFPAPEYHDPVSGNPGLGPMTSMHIVAGYDYERRSLRVRTEAYYKHYRDLLLNHETLNYVNDGYGYARGLDVFAKASLGVAEGRIAYTYLRARRMEFDKTLLAPADFDITHTVNVVLNVPLPQGFEASTAFRYASGKPFTPAPMAHNSKRLPGYMKWDVALTKLHAFPGNSLAVFFISVANVLNRGNIRDYIFSPDYSERTEVKSYFRRSIYFGVAITLS